MIKLKIFVTYSREFTSMDITCYILTNTKRRYILSRIRRTLSYKSGIYIIIISMEQ